MSEHQLTRPRSKSDVTLPRAKFRELLCDHYKKIGINKYVHEILFPIIEDNDHAKVGIKELRRRIREVNDDDFFSDECWDTYSCGSFALYKSEFIKFEESERIARAIVANKRMRKMASIKKKCSIN